MLKKCEKCGKFFGAYDDAVLCSACAEGESTGLSHISNPKEQRFLIARNIVYDKPNISPEELILEMKNKGIQITRKEILEYVRQGRLRLNSVQVSGVCEDCGKKILSGRKCPACTKKFEQTIVNESKPDKPKKEQKKKTMSMHIKK